MGLARKKLCRIIEDVCQFGIPDGTPCYMGKQKQVLDAILRAIVKGLERDGFVTIEGLGRFYTSRKKAYWIPLGFGDKRRPELMPSQVRVYFRPCKKLRLALRDQE